MITQPSFHASLPIWGKQNSDTNDFSSPNSYRLFCKNVTIPTAAKKIKIALSAAYHYELYINGTFVGRGPVHSAPDNLFYDTYNIPTPPFAIADSSEKVVQLLLLVHHSTDTYLNYLIPGEPFFLFSAEMVDDAEKVVENIVSDESWKTTIHPSWKTDVPAKGWALGYVEHYDARLEPAGWSSKIIEERELSNWHCATLTKKGGAANHFEIRPRPVPEIKLSEVVPARYRTWDLIDSEVVPLATLSQSADTEELSNPSSWISYGADSLQLCGNKAICFDLGKEYTGFYSLDVSAPEGITIDISGAELLQNKPGVSSIEKEFEEGRPWIFRKGTSYTARYITKKGRQQFTTFAWSGFRYLHIVLRTASSQKIELHKAFCTERKANIRCNATLKNEFINDEKMKAIFEMSKRTLEISTQEHLIDCPTREQAQYWGDGIFIAKMLAWGFNESRYLTWYLDCFLKVPFYEDGQISSVYPGAHGALVDYSLIPVIGQRVMYENFSKYYEPEKTIDKALKLSKWYERHINQNGLIEFDYEAGLKIHRILFIDHPGLGWHNFPHIGIDRGSVQCALNIFYIAFLETLFEMAKVAETETKTEMRNKTAYLEPICKKMKASVMECFFDGTLFHDSLHGGKLSGGTSWQTNSLAVYFNLVDKAQSKKIMRRMLDGYEELCRCSPYFHFYFLEALKVCGMEDEIAPLIKKEWGPMATAGATTVWEGFLGDEKDTLCHPWSAAPFYYLGERGDGAN